MKMDSRFATRAENVDEIAEPFGKKLKACLKPEEEVSLLVCAPANASLREKYPATVLAVTDQQWLIVAEVRPEVTEVSGATFDETLLVEFTEILLYGEVRIHFALDGKSHSTAAHFNTVTDGYYREATQLVLDGIEGHSPAARREASGYEAAPLSHLPFKFRNATVDNLPQGRQIVFATNWPTLISGFRRELAPAGVLALTERELILITEDKRRHWFESKKQPKYASIATYIPLARLAQHHISCHSRFCLLELETQVSHGAEVFEIMLPLEHESKVAECMKRAATLMALAQGRDSHDAPSTYEFSLSS
jgi:hypothetical protein